MASRWDMSRSREALLASHERTSSVSSSSRRCVEEIAEAYHAKMEGWNLRVLLHLIVIPIDSLGFDYLAH